MNNQQQTSLFRQDTQKLFLSVMFAVCLVSFFGTSGGNLSGSVGQSKGSSDRQWVDNASSIVGTESVDIDVDGKLKMEGSLIANIDKDGKDAGNLDIKAGSIEAKDLQNFDNNKETGFNLAESYGPPKDGSNDGHPNGTTTIGLKNKGYEKEGVTKATIGQGNIEVADGSDISGINRDIDNMDVITKDQITGALDATVTIDNRMFTEEGRKEILNDIENLPDNTVKVAQDISALPKQIQDVAANAYKNLIEEHPDFVTENVLQFSNEEIQNMVEKGFLIPVEEEEEEEEERISKPNINKDQGVAFIGKERHFITNEKGEVFDVTDDYIEGVYTDLKIIEYYSGLKGLKYVIKPKKLIEVLESLGTQPSNSQRIESIVKPDGRWIGAVKGSDKNIRTVNKNQLDDAIKQLEKLKVREVEKPSYSGKWYESIDGKGGYGIRNSKNNGLTIDINFPEISDKAIKIHYKP